MKRPIIDIHCDLLIYLITPNRSCYDTEGIACSVPNLIENNVKLQVMAIFAPTEANSHELGIQQSQIFNTLSTETNELYTFNKQHLKQIHNSQNIGMLAAIENASAFCDETITLKQGFNNLETITKNVKRLFYIGFTHHSENRFGGGNYTTVGLKKDGKALIDYLDNKNIAIDFSHTSDPLAYDILDYISKNNINVPIIASHSNYRTVFNHPRNLPDDIAQEIIQQQGLIGVNFLRAFVDDKNPKTLEKHIAYGIELGAENNICYGADYFYHKEHPDASRIPFFFPEHENSNSYALINEQLNKTFDSKICDKISHENVTNFLDRLWS